MELQSIFESRPDRLAQIFSENLATWTAADLGGLLRHQLRVKLSADLVRLDADLPRRLESLGLSELTLEGLLSMARPPLDILRLVKLFAKFARHDTESPLPGEICNYLYFACIAAAWKAHHQRITELEPQAIERGYQWVIAQPWIDESAKTIFQKTNP